VHSVSAHKMCALTECTMSVY